MQTERKLIVAEKLLFSEYRQVQKKLDDLKINIPKPFESHALADDLDQHRIYWLNEAIKMRNAAIESTAEWWSLKHEERRLVETLIALRRVIENRPEKKFITWHYPVPKTSLPLAS